MNIHALHQSRRSSAIADQEQSFSIAVVGLGHVGIATAAALLKDRHKVVGLERNHRILDCIRAGLSPFREPEVAELIAEGRASGNFSIATNFSEVLEASLVFVCVGTRGLSEGELDISDLAEVAGDIGRAIRRRSVNLPPVAIVFRSTMLPGTMRSVVLPTIAAEAGQAPGLNYEVAYVPEFSMEGSAVADYFDATRIIIGERQRGSAQIVQHLFSNFDVPIFVTSFETAELAKFTDNSFHALKVAFANEIGRYAFRAGASTQDIFDIFRADTKLNISSAYLRAGGAFGGPCLKKDVRALAERMQAVGVACPVLRNVLASNDSHTDFLIEEIVARSQPTSRLLLVGLSFKTGTDDIRDSPLITLTEALLELGYDLSIFDPDLGCEQETNDQDLGALPVRIKEKLFSRLPTAATWDLTIVAKHGSLIEELTGRSGAVFRIDRL
jgi:GDP-mannose 6-dehydrogenase